MKAKFLFPLYFRTIGWLLAIPGFILGYFVVYQDFEIPGFGIRLRTDRSAFYNSIENLTNEMALTCVILGLLFIAFARRKREDELIARLRLDALYWSVLINYCIFLFIQVGLLVLQAFGIKSDHGWLGDWGVFGSQYALYNLFTPLLIFIARFNYLLYFRKDGFIIPTLYYLPHYPFRIIGRWLSGACLLIILAIITFPKLENNVPEWIGGCFYLLPLGLLLCAYSRNANEDELTTQFRLESMQLAIFVNYGLLLLAIFTVYSLSFLFVMAVNYASLLLFFVLRFGFLNNKLNWQTQKVMKGGLLS